MTPQKPVATDDAHSAATPTIDRRIFGWLLFVGMIVLIAILLKPSTHNMPALELFQLKEDIEAGNVQSATVSDSEVTYTARKSIAVNPAYPMLGPFRVKIPEGLSHDWNFLHWLMDTHNNSAALILVDGPDHLIINLLLPLVPWLLIFGFVWIFVFRKIRNKSGQPQRPMPVVIVNPEAMQ